MEAPEQANDNNNADHAMENTVTVAPALCTPRFSPSFVGGEDSVSLSRTSATLPPSKASQARPFSRLAAGQITANSSQLYMSENSVATVVQRRPAPPGPIFQFSDPLIRSFVSGTHVGVEYHQSLE